MPAPVTSWSDTQIIVTVPSGVANCSLQQQIQYSHLAASATAQCGELSIISGNGKQSVDAVTVTIGGKAPTHVAATDSIQTAIDKASPGGAWVRSAGESIPPLTIAVSKRLYRGELADAQDIRRRQIQIPEVLLPMLLLLRGNTRFASPEDFVLTSRSGIAVDVANITARRLGAVGRRLNISELTFHVLRRAQAAMKKAYGQQYQYYIASAAMMDTPSSSEDPHTTRMPDVQPACSP